MECAYKIRGEIIRALERKSKKTIVYQIITKNNGNETKTIDDDSVVHEELVEITAIDEDYNLDSEPVYVEVEKSQEEESEEYINEGDVITDDPIADDSMDAVSFLLQKKELFKDDEASMAKKGRRSHRCEVCEKTFMRKSNLVDHLRLHANVR